MGLGEKAGCKGNERTRRCHKPPLRWHLGLDSLLRRQSWTFVRPWYDWWGGGVGVCLSVALRRGGRREGIFLVIFYFILFCYWYLLYFWLFSYCDFRRLISFFGHVRFGLIHSINYLILSPCFLHPSLFRSCFLDLVSNSKNKKTHACPPQIAERIIMIPQKIP